MKKLLPYFLVVLNVIGLYWIWYVLKSDRQTTYTVFLEGFFLISMIFWIISLSDLSKISRLYRVVFFIFFFVGMLFFFFKINGFSGSGKGQLMLMWRWKSPLKTTIKASEKQLESLEDYPQFLGPNRNATLNVKIQSDWNKYPPKVIWTKKIGPAWSAFSVKNSMAITQEQRGDYECVVAYDLSNGNEKWCFRNKARYFYHSYKGGEGPRSTPTITENRVYTLGGTGILSCIALSNGKKIWSKNIIEENNSIVDKWGVCGSPLVYKNLVIVSAGAKKRSLVAYNRFNGKFVWGEGDAFYSYSSPVVAELLGQKQIIIFNKTSICAHEVKHGKLLWQYPWHTKVNAAQPIVVSHNQIFLSSLDAGAAVLQIQRKNQKFTPVLKWKNRRMKNKFATSVYREGFIYGLDSGVLACIDADTGHRIWRDGRYGHGQLILLDDLLVIMAERGYLAVVEANNLKFKELARLQLFENKVWNHIAFAPPYFLLRNYEEAFCLKVAMFTE